MNDQRPEGAIKLSALSQRSAMPWVCVADPGQQMRRFLAETLQDLGCVTCECADVAELGAELDLRPPVLVVIGLAAGGIEAVFSVLAITEGRLPPTTNYVNPDPDCDLDYVPNVKRQARFGYQDSSDYFRAYRDYYASVA